MNRGNRNNSIFTIMFLLIFLFTSIQPTPVMAAEAVHNWSKSKSTNQAVSAFGNTVLLANNSFWDWLTDTFEEVTKTDEEKKAEALEKSVLPVKQAAPTGKKVPEPKKVKELVEKRTESGKFYQLSDGRVQAEISSGPIHYKDSKGKFQNIDSTLEGTTEDGFSYKNEKNRFKTHFGKQANQLLRVDLEKHQLQVGVDSKGKTVSTTVKGNTITYDGLFPDAKVKYTLQTRGVKEEVVLEKAPSDPTYSFDFKLTGVDAKAQKDGSIIFTDKQDGHTVFTIPQPMMMDSQADASSPYGKAWSSKVKQTVTQKGANITVTLQADLTWLNDPKRKWPVTIDPTIILQPTPTQSQDAMILNGTDAATNFNTSWKLSVGTTSSQIVRSLVKFDLSSIPVGTPLDMARVEMYYDQYISTPTDNTVNIDLHQMNQDWDASAVTWDQAKTGQPWKLSDGTLKPGGNFNQYRDYTEEIVDNADSGKTSEVGSWPNSTNVSGYYGSNYQVNSMGTGTESFTWIPKVPEKGYYRVDARYTAGTDRATNAPYTVNDNNGSTVKTVNQQINGNTWNTLGSSFYFNSGNTHSIQLKDNADGYVIADAVRLLMFATDAKNAGENNARNYFSARRLIQGWVNGTIPNYGAMLKATTETLGQGGPRYTASQNYDESDIRPRIILVYGEPSVYVKMPMKMYGTGAEINWQKYTGSDFEEYQIHRGYTQDFKPDESTLIAPVTDVNTLTFTDTTAKPKPADETGLDGNAYYYQVALKKKNGQILRSNTVMARLPKAGVVKQIFQLQTPDAHITSAEPTTNKGALTSVRVGTESSDGVTISDKNRGLVKFDLAPAQIPTDTNLIYSSLQLWGWQEYGDAGTIDVHGLNQAFDETTTTWNLAKTATNWTTAGGSYTAPAAGSLSGFTNDPKWYIWNVTSLVKSWVNGSKTNNGFLLKKSDETNYGYMDFLSQQAQVYDLRPQLYMYYTDTQANGSFHAPATPEVVNAEETKTIDVTLTNTTSTTWTGNDFVLSYDWQNPDGTAVTDVDPSVDTSLKMLKSDGTVETTTRNVAPGESITVRATVKAPKASDYGSDRRGYNLNWKLRNKTTGTTTGIPPAMPQKVAVKKAKSSQIGMEKFYQYTGKNTGAGSTAMVNLANGNAMFSYDPLTNPSRGLSTFLRMTYNSMDTSDSILGYGWSMSASSIMRLGTPLDVHPKTLLDNNDTTQAGTITLTDGDGTTHEFDYDTTKKTFISPPGVNLYLQLNQAQSKPNEPVARKWVMTKPDRTQFFFDNEGFLTAIRDKNGNELLYSYEERKSNNKPTKFLRYITDVSGRKTLTLDYYTKADAPYPKVIDLVKQITDISGRKLTFTYSDKGLLTNFVDGAGLGTSVEKKFDFVYDSTQGNKNTKMVSVKDPRGNTTSFTYYEAPVDPKDKWKIQTIKDRLNGVTKFDYAPNATNPNYTDATVTDGLNQSTKYLLDELGKPVQITNAKNETSKITWDADYNVTRLEEDNGAATTWTYDGNGFPLTITDAENNAIADPAQRKSTKLEYQYSLLSPDGIYHVAEPIKKTSPEGRVFTFAYDLVGNLISTTDPKGNATATAGDYTTTYAYHGTSGLLKSTTDANGRVTKYGNDTQADYGYDPNGYPKTITDAREKVSSISYGVRGEVLQSTDALGKTSTYTYDGFGRPLTTKIPKDQNAGVYIQTTAPVYDQNDNVTQSTAPNGAVTTVTYDAADQTTDVLAPKDTPTGSERKSSYEYDIIGQLKKQTEPKGTLTTTDANDFLSTYEYDAVGQVTKVTNALGHSSTFEYDNVGNQVKVTEPKGVLTTTDATDYTTTTTYDKNHRPTKVTDALGKFATTVYNSDGDVLSTTDKEGNTVTNTYDERGALIETKVPHKKDASNNITYNTTKYEYDAVGNQIKVVTPRGVETTTETGDYTHEKVYDELNRVKEVIYPRDPSSGNTRYSATNKMIYTYDDLGRVTNVSAPASEGQTKRNDTTTAYFDNGWVKSSKDGFGVTTTYDYNVMGQQIARTIAGAGGSTPRTMSWDFYPDGKLKSRSDTGIPQGSQAVVVDNNETQDIATVGTWTAVITDTGFEGADHHTSPASTSGTNSFTWNLSVPEAGAYNVYVKYAVGANRVTDASYSVTHKDGTATVTKNQQTNGGTWVLLGKYTFDQTASVQLSNRTANAGTGLVVDADAVKIEKDLTGITDTENKDFAYNYDVNGNMTSMTDNSPGANIKTYVMSYTGLNQLSRLEQKDSANVVKQAIDFVYDENGNSTKRTYDQGVEEFEYDIRNLLTKVTHKKNTTDPAPKVTTYQYNGNGFVTQETLPNQNQTAYTYNLDGSLATQITKKDNGNGAVVNQHTLEYNANGHKTKDTLSLVDAKGTNVNSVLTYQYDPMDRLTNYTKTGSNARTESYVHDANSNVVTQTIDGVTTSYTYDRNRLVSTSSNGASAKYNYDVYGRLRSVTSAGILIEQNTYDGFDHIKEKKSLKEGTINTYNVTKSFFDPMDRTTQKVEQAGTASTKTTDYVYLGLGNEVLLELQANKVLKSYQYSPTGKRLGMVNHKDTGDESSYYGYNPHTDVEMTYKEDGSVEGTYGYTAYGNLDKEATTGPDDPKAPDFKPEEPHNVYRYSGKRWDPGSESYDMGFRDYSPGLNRFTTMDMYNGAFANMGLASSPYTNNPYGFTYGNPISGIEMDGHETAFISTWHERSQEENQEWMDRTGEAGKAWGDLYFGTAEDIWTIAFGQDFDGNKASRAEAATNIVADAVIGYATGGIAKAATPLLKKLGNAIWDIADNYRIPISSGLGTPQRTNPRTRLPKTEGRWEGEAGNGLWYSNKADVISITDGEPVRFTNGRPDFSPWSEGSYTFESGQLNGRNSNDFSLVYEIIKNERGYKYKYEAQNWLSEQGLTIHHLNSTTVQLIPTSLHANVPHIGSASDLRGGN